MVTRPWATPEPGRLVGHGHPAGDFLEAWAWDLLEEGDGVLRVSAHLPDHVRNPRGQLFGGFTPTYVDLIALFTVRIARTAQRADRASVAGHSQHAGRLLRTDRRPAVHHRQPA